MRSVKLVRTKPVFLKQGALYEKEIKTFEEYKRNRLEYKKLISQYSKLISSQKKIVSVADLNIKPTEYAVELNHVSKYYLTEKKINKVFFDVSLKIKIQDFVVILGPSGSGKTTLLNIMSGLENTDAGDVFVQGQNLTLLNSNGLTNFRRRYISLIFQQYNLLQNITAGENVELGINLLEDDTRTLNIDELLKTLEIDKFVNSFPFQLSGGQQQRFSIARAISKNPDILFCDEPTGALDQKMSRKVLSVLLEINKKYKTTIVLVTHNENFAKIANSIIHFKDGQVISSKVNQKPISIEKLEI
ncbi:MAG: ABC transporter ATP-binding protein [Mollicutes bacterium]|nr:MAG: ABC transporter ATP-binding protein [Mollicutes bacterium]